MTFRLNAFHLKDIMSKDISPKHNLSKTYFIEYDILSKFRLKLSKFRLKIKKNKVMEHQTDFLFQEPTISRPVCNFFLMILDGGSSDYAAVSLIFAIDIFTMRSGWFGPCRPCSFSQRTSPSLVIKSPVHDRSVHLQYILSLYFRSHE